MIAGNIGSDAIMSYTVIGDAVNLGSRLESLNKQYGTRIIISDATRQRLDRPISSPSARRRRRQRQDQPVAIFEVVGRAARSIDSNEAARHEAGDRRWRDVLLALCASPAHAQFGGIDRRAEEGPAGARTPRTSSTTSTSPRKRSGRSARTSAPRSASASASCRARRSTST